MLCRKQTDYTKVLMFSLGPSRQNFFYGEGHPVSRLLYNPVTFFRVMEHQWNEIYRENPKYWGENLFHKSHMDRTQASAVRGRRLTALSHRSA
jgi:hypothetical protein